MYTIGPLENPLDENLSNQSCFPNSFCPSNDFVVCTLDMGPECWCLLICLHWWVLRYSGVTPRKNEQLILPITVSMLYLN
jgi:hypothetical protein